jgi:hypothetical protein
MTFIYSALKNIEPVPQKFIDLALDQDYDKNLPKFKYFATTFSSEYLERSVTVDHESYKTRYQRKYNLGQEFLDWCHTNLHQNCYHTGVAYNQGNSPYHGPHIDKARKYTFFYLLEAGGSNVTTSFWKHPDLPVEPTEQDFPSYACDYQGLELLNQCVFKPKQWYLFNVGIIHSVENIIGPLRIGLQASLDYNTDLTTILKNT